MKKPKGIARAVDLIDINELENWGAKRLLARLQRLRWCEQNQQVSDLSAVEVASIKDKVLFKDSEQWRLAYRDVKRVLAKRDHLGE